MFTSIGAFTITSVLMMVMPLVVLYIRPSPDCPVNEVTWKWTMRFAWAVPIAHCASFLWLILTK